MERLTKEIECSVCLEIYTDPRILPCLHTFCLHCLNRLAEKRVNQEPIACPDCRTEIALPEGGNFNTFPSSFHLNRLRDIVSTQNEGHQVLCNNCDKKSSATAFCFNCECFNCDECRELHSRLKIWKGHRLTALSAVQDADIQEILGRPQLCEEPRHTSEVLEFFCETCQRCICQKCAIITHKDHELVHLDDAADQAKLRLEESMKKVQAGVRICEARLKKDQKTYRKLEEQIAAAELSARRNTQRFIDLAKQHERDMMTKLATIREDQGREFEGRKEKLELRLGQLSSVTDFFDSVLKREISGEILRAEPSVGNRSEELLKTLEELQPVKSQHVKYIPNEDIYQSVEQVTLGRVLVAQMVVDPEKTQIQGFEKLPIFINDCAQFTVVTRDNEENVCHSTTEEVTVQILSPAGDVVENEVQDREDGSYSVSFTPKTKGVHHLTVKVQGQSPRNCHVDVNVRKRIPHSYKHLSSFGSYGSGNGQFDHPVDISVSSTGELAVSDLSNHRVQIFSNAGQFVRKFGSQGKGNGQFQSPTGVAYNKIDNIVVCDLNNCRIQVFSPAGQWISKFGEGALKRVCGVSVTNDNNVVVCDKTAKKVFVFSPEGRLLLQFAKNQITGDPFAIFHDGKYFVSSRLQVVRVFDSQGTYLYDIGKGQLNTPAGLAVDVNDLLLVCDEGKHCVQVFTLKGKFVTSFGSRGSVQRQFNAPLGITVIADGRVFVCDFQNHCIQVFQPQY